MGHVQGTEFATKRSRQPATYQRWGQSCIILHKSIIFTNVFQLHVQDEPAHRSATNSQSLKPIDQLTQSHINSELTGSAVDPDYPRPANKPARASNNAYTVYSPCNCRPPSPGERSEAFLLWSIDSIAYSASPSLNRRFDSIRAYHACPKCTVL
jgi:hypothetical protein